MDNSNAQYSLSEDRVGFVDYVIFLVKRRKVIIVSFLVFSIFSVILSLIIPKKYTANSTIMPPSTRENPLGGFSLNVPFAGLSSLLSGTTAEVSVLISILNSRTIAETTVKKFNLMERYNSKTFNDAVKTFQKKMSVDVDEEGAIQIVFSTETKFFHPEDQEETAKKLSASVVNFVVEELNRTNTQLQTRQAKYYRIFIEERYRKNKEDLYQIEEEMKEFSETYGMISLPEQVEAAVTAAAKLKSEYTIREIELKALQNTLQSNHPQVKRKEIELAEMKNKLQELKFGKLGNDSIQIFPTFQTAPELGARYVRLRRELEVQNIIYEYLTQQYEQAKLQEAKDTPTVQIIDEAILPQRRSSPVRSLFVAVFALIGILFGIFLAAILEYFHHLSEVNPQKYNTVVSVLRETRKDIFGRKSGTT